jgi:hypothetical protein
MPAGRLRRVPLLPLILAATLALSAAARGAALGYAAPVPLTSAAFGADTLGGIWDWIKTLWPLTGCGLDPNGACARTTPRPPGRRPQEGCGLDPNGRCAYSAPRPALRPQEGCGIDPNARCAYSAPRQAPGRAGRAGF